MNTHAEYRRHAHQAAPEPPTTAAADSIANHLAVGRDPSVASTPTHALTTATGKHIAWVRPTELHTFASPIIGRGIDLHAELMRRARQGPRQASRAAQRLAPARRSPALDNASQEGISL
ncbi:hypothetical protein [Nocardioides sp. KR10-350]|jgi:hypothetical protein|uniref:hypothetical protein n=1 Tax=Nocardioides cheoyonin TaxID=3156615 RepID=UPI0032B33734